MSTEIARIWGDLSWCAKHDGADVLIAATALSRGLVVVTRNVRHFDPLSIKRLLSGSTITFVDSFPAETVPPRVFRFIVGIADFHTLQIIR